MLLVLIYALLPVACMAGQGAGAGKQPTLLDFAAILLLWLPIEFGAGAGLVPIQARGYLHSMAYGIAILLGLVLFRCYRALPGLKLQAPRSAADVRLPLAAFALLAPVLAVVGIAIGFISWPHHPGEIRRCDVGRCAGHCCRHSAARGNPLPVADSKLADATLWR